MLVNKSPSVDELSRMAKFCVALYQTDKVIQSAYVASNLFELIVHLWVEEQNVTCTNDDSLGYKISKLNYYDIEYTKHDLFDLKEIRNNIVHGYIHTMDTSKVLELVYFVWDILDKESYLQNNENIEQLNLGTAYYWIRDFEVIDSNCIDKPIMNTISIEKSDFNNLYIMAEKFRALSKYISTNKKLGKLSLSVDNISGINSTSAYVWLAITSGKYKGRQKIESVSISILATPENIRIYIDFGGFAFNDRVRYLEFIKTIKTEEFNIPNTDNLYFFDIEWYSYIENKIVFTKLNLDQKNDKILLAKEILKKHNKKNPLTSSVLLIGYILEKQDLSFDVIWNKLNNIISVYNKFQSFKI